MAGKKGCPICGGDGIKKTPVDDKKAEGAFGIPLVPGTTYAHTICRCWRNPTKTKVTVGSAIRGAFGSLCWGQNG